MEMKMTKVVAQVCFNGGDPACDPAAAAVALARQGFEVALMPERYRAMLDGPGDDHLEASRRVAGNIPQEARKNTIEGYDYAKLSGEVDSVMDEVNAIVDCYGGDCYECGPEADDHVADFSRLTVLPA